MTISRIFFLGIAAAAMSFPMVSTAQAGPFKVNTTRPRDLSKEVRLELKAIYPGRQMMAIELTYYYRVNSSCGNAVVSSDGEYTVKSTMPVVTSTDVGLLACEQPAIERIELPLINGYRIRNVNLTSAGIPPSYSVTANGCNTFFTTYGKLKWSVVAPTTVEIQRPMLLRHSIGPDSCHIGIPPVPGAERSIRRYSSPEIFMTVEIEGPPEKPHM